MAGSESARIGGDDAEGARHETIAIEKTDKVCPLCEDRAARPCLIVGGRLAVWVRIERIGHGDDTERCACT